MAPSTIIAEWFEGREVAFAVGIGLDVGSLGSVWNNVASPKVANSNSIESAFWMGALLTCCSLVMTGLIVIVGRRATRQLKRRAGNEEVLQALTVALLQDDGGRD